MRNYGQDIALKRNGMITFGILLVNNENCQRDWNSNLKGWIRMENRQRDYQNVVWLEIEK